MTRALSKPSRRDLTHYDPARGLKTIAVAEAAEKHFARAKDAAGVQKAIRKKLEEQADFVAWWDHQAEKASGGHPSDRRRRSATAIQAGTNGMPERYVIERWRKRVGSPEALDAAELAALAKYKKFLLLVDDLNERLKSSLSNEWYTPKRYLDAARQVLGAFDLDPASSATANKEVGAAEFYTAKDNGLEKPWHGRVWLNPPYGGVSGPFTERLIDQFVCGNVTAAILLVNSNSTDAGWFQPLWDYLLCFTNHRINFVSPGGGSDSGSTHGSVFVYLGQDRESFISQFAPIGAVVERAQ